LSALLDTHVWVWWLTGGPRLSRAEREALDDVGVILQLDRLPRRFHGDPADRLIVATARAHSLALATHDRNIRRSRTVKLWKP
jgi:PIN domain nuclease of toxin-antitoxin system